MLRSRVHTVTGKPDGAATFPFGMFLRIQLSYTLCYGWTSTTSPHALQLKCEALLQPRSLTSCTQRVETKYKIKKIQRV
uniref:Uncharacterized protein n=1 Tax=Trichogramma kaykai TaxID=54128 RepID=A0ABD2WJG9_9HYME